MMQFEKNNSNHTNYQVVEDALMIFRFVQEDQFFIVSWRYPLQKNLRVALKSNWKPTVEFQKRVCFA